MVPILIKIVRTIEFSKKKIGSKEIQLRLVKSRPFLEILKSEYIFQVFSIRLSFRIISYDQASARFLRFILDKMMTELDYHINDYSESRVLVLK